MIKIKDLYYTYDMESDENKRLALNGLSLNIPKNKHTIILGHNGSGKSTLAKLIIGLIKANSGSIEVNDIILNEDSINEIRSLCGIVFQNPDNQFIGSTVQDDIAFGLENKCIRHNDMQAIINHSAKLVKMDQYLEHEPTRLSGGQKQRVAIAGVLAMKPKIMIFDEACSMLDPKGVNEVNEIIDDLLKNNNITLISITHDIDYALRADNVIVLDKGKLLYEGKPEDIFKHSLKLKEIGLDIPFSLKISNALKDKGIKIKDCLNIKELEKEIWLLK